MTRKDFAKKLLLELLNSVDESEVRETIWFDKELRTAAKELYQAPKDEYISTKIMGEVMKDFNALLEEMK